MGPRFQASTTLFLACLAAIAAPAPSLGAEATRVATAFDPNDPFDLDFSIGFERTQRRAQITRERYQGGIQDVLELRYMAVTQRMPIRVALGLFHDLEVHAGASYVFNYDQSYWYPAARDPNTNSLSVTPGTSTIQNNCLDARGNVLNPACVSGTSSTGTQPIFAMPNQDSSINTFRGGLSDIYVGLSWAPFSDERDDTKPKWVLSFDYTAPNGLTSPGSVNKPWVPATESDKGGITDGAHRFTFSTAISKRLGAIDPYIKFSYTLPVSSSASPSNCNMPQSLIASNMGYAENCGVGPWTSSETGSKPPQVAGFLFGSEFYPYDNPSKHQRVSIDVQLGALYVSEGRSANELSDAVGKLLYNEEYLTLGGSIGVYARAAQYVQLKLNASLYTDTAHFLTNEKVGKDGNNNGQVDLCGAGATNCPEVNPNFDFRYDMPGRRFRISDTSVFSVSATAVVNF